MSGIRKVADLGTKGIRSIADDATLPSTVSIGNVSGTELGYIDGVTSAIQTQINTKSPTASPTFTGTATIPTLSVTGTSSMSDTLSFPWSGTNINATGTLKGNGAVIQFVKTDHGPYDLTSNAYVASATMSPKYSTSTMYVWVNYHAYKYNTTGGVNNAYQLHQIGGGNIRQNPYMVYSSPEYMFQGIVSGTIAAGSTSSRTYAFYVNASSSADRIYFYWLTFYVMEIAA